LHFLESPDSALFCQAQNCTSDKRVDDSISMDSTRFGEFSQIGRLFTLGSYFKQFRSSLQFWATLFHDYGCAVILTKSVLGYTLGDFPISSCGHLVWVTKMGDFCLLGDCSLSFFDNRKKIWSAILPGKGHV
jgi:hypothetical protein